MTKVITLLCLLTLSGWVRADFWDSNSCSDLGLQLVDVAADFRVSPPFREADLRSIVVRNGNNSRYLFIMDRRISRRLKIDSVEVREREVKAGASEICLVERRGGYNFEPISSRKVCRAIERICLVASAEKQKEVMAYLRSL